VPRECAGQVGRDHPLLTVEALAGRVGEEFLIRGGFHPCF
jgi:hypothetical protein